MRSNRSRISAAAFILFFGVGFCSAYTLEGPSWTLDRTVQMQLSLGGPRLLSDGFTSFNESARDALNSWNAYLPHLQFAPIMNSPIPPGDNDYQSSAYFSNTAFGKAFGSGTLAVTQYHSNGNVMDESDTAFNNAYTWDSYRGPQRSGVIDFHRVALHEFGHALGLDHPDEAVPAQYVVAVMNSHVSDIDSLQSDDINGALALYGSGPAYQTGGNAPVLLNLSTRAFFGSDVNVLIGGFIVQGSEPVTLILRALSPSLRASGFASVMDDTTITLRDANNNIIATNDDWVRSSDATTIASYRLDPPNDLESALYITLNPGSYTVTMQSYADASQPATIGVGLVEIYDLHQTSSHLANLSTRGLVQTGDNILIGGFIVGAGATKTVAVRALGPTLADRGVPNSIADPTVELRDGSGNLVAANDNWQDSASAAAIQAEGLAPAHASESALQVSLAPGSYTGLVRGANDGTGIGLVEIYDVGP